MGDPTKAVIENDSHYRKLPRTAESVKYIHGLFSTVSGTLSPPVRGDMPSISTEQVRTESSGLNIGGVPLGDRPWLVLGGGGLRGLAHLGVWRVLQQAGLRPAGIVGTSIGALVGASLAAGRPLEELEEIARSVSREKVARMPRRFLWPQGIRSSGLYRGDTLMNYIEKVAPAGGWASLRIPFQVNAVELGSGRTEWFGTGARTDVRLPQAIYASAALPVFYPPCPLPGGHYVDGGTKDALPIPRAAELGASGIIAVDVGAAETADASTIVERGMLAIHDRVFAIMSGAQRRSTVRKWTGPPLVYIRPQMVGRGPLEFGRVEEMLEAGRKAAEAVLGNSEDVS